MKYKIYYSEDDDKYISSDLIDRFSTLVCCIIDESEIEVKDDDVVYTPSLANYFGFDYDKDTFVLSEDGYFRAEEITENDDTFVLTPQYIIQDTLEEMGDVNCNRAITDLILYRLEKQGYKIIHKSNLRYESKGNTK